jgi:hypothetical protein
MKRQNFRLQKKQRILHLEGRNRRRSPHWEDRYLAAGRIATRRVLRRRTTGQVSAILARPKKRGRQFFLQAIKALGREATQEEWNRLGEQALRRGRLTFARHAFEKSGNTEGIRQVHEAGKAPVDGGGVE